VAVEAVAVAAVRPAALRVAQPAAAADFDEAVVAPPEAPLLGANAQAQAGAALAEVALQAAAVASVRVAAPP
jgi:hypothetical protein